VSKGMKKVVGVVAAIAIPFAAPLLAPLALSAAVGSIAASVGFSGAVAAGIGSAVAAGVTGAALGAGAAALTGGSIGKGALYGGLGSALTGGLKGYNTATTMANGGRAAVTAPGVASAGANVGSAVRPGTAIPGANASGITQGVTSGAAAVTGAPAGGGGSVLKSIGSALGNVAPSILKQAAIYLASGAMSATNPEEKRLIEEAANRMREIQGQDDALYRQLLQEANSIDPAATAEQWYTDAKNQGIAATEAATENMSPRGGNAIAEVTRRGLQDAALHATQAYRTGYDSAATNRRAALGAVGDRPRTNAAGYALGLNVDEGNRRGIRRAGIVSTLTGILTPDPGEDPDPRVAGQENPTLATGGLN
jgi:hypothetical protein